MHDLGTFLRDDVFMMKAWNSSVTVTKHLGDCHQMLARNETDMIPFLVIYGIHPDIMTYFSVIMESSQTILSGVKPTNQTEMRTTASLAAFEYFKSDAIAVTLMFMLMFYLLLYSYCQTCKMLKPLMLIIQNNGRVDLQRKRNPNTPSIILMAALLKQMTACSTLNRKRLSFRLILLLLMGLMAWIQFMFISFTKTELVIVGEPFIFDSYQRLLSDPKIMPAWFVNDETIDTYWRTGQEERVRKLWNKARSNTCPKDYHKCLLRPTSDTLVDFVSRISNQRIAMIAIDYAARLSHAAICLLSRKMNMNPIVMRSDKDAVLQIPQALSYSKFFQSHSPVVAKTLAVRGMLVAQSGMAIKVSIPTKSVVASIAGPENVRKCLYPLEDDYNQQVFILSKSWRDFRILLLICCVLLIMTTFLLIFSGFKILSTNHSSN